MKVGRKDVEWLSTEFGVHARMLKVWSMPMSCRPFILPSTHLVGWGLLTLPNPDRIVAIEIIDKEKVL